MIHYSKVRNIKVKADEVGKETDPFPKFLEEAFNLPSNLASQVAYAIAHCSSPLDPTLEALKRTRRYIKSIGRYGSGAFLVGQYGGAGEIAQGFCRYVPLYSLPALQN
jgi:RAB protein geranylgeranyltransferase component A